MKGYIFDMDGVIWDGDMPIAHAAEKITSIIKAGNRYVFMTNNALRSRNTYVKRLKEYGIDTDKSHVITSSYAAGQYIKKLKGPSKVFVMGNGELKAELVEAGHAPVEEGADFVVNGLDKEMNYDKMSKALCNLSSGAELLTCAPDLTYIDNGRIKLGSGAFAVALEAASGKKMKIVGKPSKIIMEIAKDAMGIKPSECISVGDKLETDILAGKREGMKTVLVLTGETNGEKAKRSDIKADYVIKDLRELP